MSKSIVLCLDGTWNGPDAKTEKGDLSPSNVQKLFEALTGSRGLQVTENELEISSPNQVAKYIHGVGDATNWLAEKVEGATGLGLVARIVRGYTYLSRVYEPGDQIYIVGFSRGAYTARALGGFIARQGLLDWKAMGLQAGSDTSYSAGLSAWEEYKSSLHSGNSKLLHQLAHFFTSAYDHFQLALHPAPKLQFVKDVPIAAVAVWDTVGSLGIPDLATQDGALVDRDVFQFADKTLNEKIRHGIHAVAADEQRVLFTPTLWDARDGIIQVIFPGAHGDVGGGYPLADSGLSDCALLWMARQLAGIGVTFNHLPAATPNANGTLHRPWITGAIKAPLALRQLGIGLSLSQRVLQRLGNTSPIEADGTPHPYQPPNLVNSYLSLDWSGPAPHVEVEP